MSTKSKVVLQRVVCQLWRPQHTHIKQRVLLSMASNSMRSSPAATRNQSSSTPASHDQQKVQKAKSTFRLQERTGTKQDVEISNRLRLIRPGASQGWPYSTNPEKVLVIFLPWLNSKEKHVNKYIQLYLDLGLDVLCVKSKPQDFLWPPTSFGVARELTEVLQEWKHYDRFIFHSMSIGSYNLTTFRVLAKEVEEVSELNKKVCGIIYDSIVIGAGRGGALAKSGTGSEEDSSKAMDRFIRGIAGSVKGSKIFLPFVSLIAKLYFTLTKKQTLDYYERAYDVVRDEPAKVPTLLFASKNDPMCDKDVVTQIVRIWKDDHEVPITLQMWDVSGHAQHLSFHRKDYMDVQRKFFDSIFGGNGVEKAASQPSTSSKL